MGGRSGGFVVRGFSCSGAFLAGGFVGGGFIVGGFVMEFCLYPSTPRSDELIRFRRSKGQGQGCYKVKYFSALLQRTGRGTSLLDHTPPGHKSLPNLP